MLTAQQARALAPHITINPVMTNIEAAIRSAATSGRVVAEVTGLIPNWQDWCLGIENADLALVRNTLEEAGYRLEIYAGYRKEDYGTGPNALAVESEVGRGFVRIHWDA